MKTVKVIIEYLKGILSGSMPLLVVYLYDGALRLSYLYTTINPAKMTVKLNLSPLDWYFFADYVITIPLVRHWYSHIYRDDKVEFETYKDKALKMHHSDIQANHKNRAWSANGVTSNPWEFMYSQTQSYKGVSDSAFNYFKNFVLNLGSVLKQAF